MAHTNKKKLEQQKQRGATFLGYRPQYFKHKDDPKLIRRNNKRDIDKYFDQ